jgi:hypothetical protein
LAESAGVDAFDKPCARRDRRAAFRCGEHGRVGRPTRGPPAPATLSPKICVDLIPSPSHRCRAGPNLQPLVPSRRDRRTPTRGGRRPPGRSGPGPARSPWGDSGAPPRHPRPHPRVAGRAMCLHGALRTSGPVRSQIRHLQIVAGTQTA